MSATVPSSNALPIAGTLPTPTNSGVTKGVVVTAYENGSVSLIAPFVGAADGTSSASVGVLKVDNVVYTGIDAVMEVDLEEADAVALLNSFSVKERNGNPFSADYTGDKLPLVDVDFDAAGGFSAVMRKVLTTSREVAPATHSTVTTYFNEQMRISLNAVLNETGLLDMLEASNVDNVSVVLDMSAGAIDMTSKVAGTTSNSTFNDSVPARRRLFATQIPLATWVQYLVLGVPPEANEDEGRTQLDFLPMKGNDSITFVFDITVAPPSSLATSASAVASGLEGFTIEANGQFGATTLNVSLAPTQRRIAFKATLKNSEGSGKPFAPNYEMSRAAVLAAIPDVSGSTVPTVAAAKLALAAAPFNLQPRSAAAAYSVGAEPTLTLPVLGDVSAEAVVVMADVSAMTLVLGDVSGIALAAGASWMLGAGSTLYQEKIDTNVKAVALTAITLDISAGVGTAAADVATKSSDKAAKIAGLTVSYTEGMKYDDTSILQGHLDNAIASAAAATAAAADAEWVYRNSIYEDTPTVTSPSHAAPPVPLSVLEVALEAARIALREAIDDDPANVDPEVTAAFEAAAEAVSAKMYALANSAAALSAKNAADATKAAADASVTSLTAALAIAQAKEVGTPTSTQAEVDTATEALTAAEAVLAAKQAAYAVAKAASGLAEAAAATALALYNAGYTAAYEIAYNAHVAAYNAQKAIYDAAVAAALAAFNAAKDAAHAKYLSDNAAALSAFNAAKASAIAAWKTAAKAWAVRKAIKEAYTAFLAA